MAAASTRSIFSTHGPPLVLKTDNGSLFVAEPFEELLKQWQVLALLSPPRTPRYNGAVEADSSRRTPLK
jgi:transposase InsO family protein